MGIPTDYVILMLGHERPHLRELPDLLAAQRSDIRQCCGQIGVAGGAQRRMMRDDLIHLIGWQERTVMAGMPWLPTPRPSTGRAGWPWRQIGGIG